MLRVVTHHDIEICTPKEAIEDEDLGTEADEGNPGYKKQNK